MKIKVLFFGRLAELAEVNEVELQEINNTAALHEYIKAHYQQLMNSKFAVAVNKKITGHEVEFSNGDVIALIPPFSGG